MNVYYTLYRPSTVSRLASFISTYFRKINETLLVNVMISRYRTSSRQSTFILRFLEHDFMNVHLISMGFAFYHMSIRLCHKSD